MALGSALVDKAWRISRVKSTEEKIDGEKVMGDPTEGPRFRCRLEISSGSEQQQDGRYRRVQTPTLLMGKNSGLKADDEVKVRSKQALQHLGAEEITFKINGDPTPLRKRRTVIGYQYSLTQVR